MNKSTDEKLKDKFLQEFSEHSHAYSKMGFGALAIFAILNLMIKKDAEALYIIIYIVVCWALIQILIEGFKGVLYLFKTNK